MSTPNQHRSEQPWRGREDAALRDLAGQLEVACEALHEDVYASLDDFADQLEATAERMPWQSGWRRQVELMTSDAREGRGDLAYWVGTWRLAAVAAHPVSCPSSAAADVALDWREVDGELRLVEREAS